MTDNGHLTQSVNYHVRRGSISAYGRGYNSAVLLNRVLLATITVCALVIVIVLFALFVYGTGSVVDQSLPEPTISRGLFTAIVVTLSGLLVLLLFIRRFTTTHFIEPDLAFRKWLQQVCDGDLEARIGLSPRHPHFQELNFHTRNLASSLARLSDEMETLVGGQTKRLESQNRQLDLLFRLASDVVRHADRRSVIRSICSDLAEWYNNARVRAFLFGDQIDCIADLNNRAIAQADTGIDTGGEFDGDDGVSFLREYVSSKENSLDRNRQLDRVIHREIDTPPYTQRIELPVLEVDQPIAMIVIDHSRLNESESRINNKILATVSEQLSLFMSKKLAEINVREAKLQQGRTQFAADLHDSLAQTLLALKYKLTTLQSALDAETQHQLNESPQNREFQDEFRHQIEQLSSTVDEANKEVRELIGGFRESTGDLSAVMALQSVINQFGLQSELEAFFQAEDQQIAFAPKELSVVSRIVTEALANADKYSSAATVRVLLSVGRSGTRHVLIEDDGVGFDYSSVRNARQNEYGDHIGISLMQERALSIGANLDIDSEPGEGTRVSIALPPFFEADGRTVGVS